MRAPLAATEPRRALAPAEYTALGSACTARRDCMPAEVVAVTVAAVAVVVVVVVVVVEVLEHWGIRRT